MGRKRHSVASSKLPFKVRRRRVSLQLRAFKDPENKIPIDFLEDQTPSIIDYISEPADSEIHYVLFKGMVELIITSISEENLESLLNVRHIDTPSSTFCKFTEVAENVLSFNAKGPALLDSRSRSTPPSVTMDLDAPSPAPSPQVATNVAPSEVRAATSETAPAVVSTEVRTPADQPESTQATGQPQRRPRPRYAPLDLTNIRVPVPATALTTVIFRPLTSTDDLTKVNQVLLYRELQALAEPSHIRDLRGGALAADFPASTPLSPLLAISGLQGIAVRATQPAGLRCKTGVVKNLHPDITEGEFLSEVSSTVPIRAFKRLAKPGATSWVVKLSFDGQELPESIRFAGRTFRVAPYLARPVQCRTCHKFNHVAASCKSGLRCPRCGDPHDLASCPVPDARCPNCGGPHTATDLSCPAWAFETKVSEVRTTTGLPLTAAKVAVRKAARSYAAAAQQATLADRPEPSRNRIFKKPQPQASTLTSDAAAAILAAAKNDPASLLSLLEAILTAFTGTALPAGALAALVARSSGPSDP